MKTFQKWLISPPIRAPPGAGGHYMLETNFWNIQVGRMLLQKQSDKTKKPVRYSFRILTKVNNSYDTTQPESVAIVWSVLLLRTSLK